MTRPHVTRPRAPARVTGSPVRSAAHARTFALFVAGGFGAAMAFLAFVFHSVPLYGVETDLFGEYIPAAQALLAGQPNAAQYEFKGPGYPALLALSTLPVRDAWIAARLLNLVAAVAGAWFAFRIVRRTVGAWPAGFVLAALCATPLYVRTTVEAGTDMPAFALGMIAMDRALGARGVRGALLAGAFAGAAILCRYNMAFLVPAALVTLALVRDPAATFARRSLGYLAGLAGLLVPWLVLNHAMTGDALANRNYVNLAFELYGEGMRWDAFWTDVAPRFHSFADVLLYDPGRALVHWLRNLGTRWLVDLRTLVPVWMGVAAVAGVVLHARRATRGAVLLVHFVLCYATLALVFYTPRFFLFLVPLYLVGTALAFLPRVAVPRGLRRGLAVAGAAAIVASWAMALRETTSLLADAPTEVVAAGRVLRAVAQPGDRLLARKPQVAYFAHMTYVPMPQVETLRTLLAEARRAGGTHLHMSGIELSLRPQFRLLGETDVALPGFTRIARDLGDPEHPYVLFRIEPASAADSGFTDSLVAALTGMSARNPTSAEAQAYVGALLLDEGRIEEALACLDRAVALAPEAVQPRGFRAPALFEAGRLDEAAADCEVVLAKLERPPAAFHLLLGSIRVRQDRWEEARAAFEKATGVEPANIYARLALGLSLFALGRGVEGQAEFDQAVRLEPKAAWIPPVALGFASTGDRVGLARMVARFLGGGGSLEDVREPPAPASP